MKSVISKELLGLRRDGRFKLTVGLFAALLIASIAFGIVEHRAFERERQLAVDIDAELWMQQGDKDPHGATHYGQYVFRPRSELFWMDRGVDDLLGTTTFLESHNAGKSQGAAVENRPWSPPLVDLSPSNLVLVILPLLALILGHSTWNGERKLGTLATTIAVGADARKILRGKVLALVAVTGALAGAAALLGLLVVVAEAKDLVDGLSRWGLLTAVYAVSTWIYTLLGVLASVIIRSPAKSLLAVLGCWAVTMILVPRAVNSIANQTHVYPDQSSLDAMISDMRANGLNGDDPRAERTERFQQGVLEEYGVEDFDSLPVLYAGLALQWREEYDNQIFDKVEESYAPQREGRERIRQWAYYLSPASAARALSRLGAGTDQAHHAWFAAEAEAKRRAYVKALNDHLAFETEQHRAGDEELWAESAVGAIPVPPLASMMHHALRPGLSLLGWFVVTLGLFLFVWRRADRDPVTLGE